jgi:hypothetical protein
MQSGRAEVKRLLHALTRLFRNDLYDVVQTYAKMHNAKVVVHRGPIKRIIVTFPEALIMIGDKRSSWNDVDNYSLVIDGEGWTWGHAYEQLFEKLADHENMRDIASFKEWTMTRR